MGWDAEDAERYRTISESLGKLALTMVRGDSDSALKNLLLDMSASCKKLASYYHSREETAHLRCGPDAVESDEDRRASLEARAILARLQGQWAELAAALDEGPVRRK